LPMLMFVKGGCLLYLGKKDESKRLISQVYHTCDMFGNQTGMDAAKDFAKTKLDLDLDTPI